MTATVPTHPEIAPVSAPSERQALNRMRTAIDNAVKSGTIKQN